MEILALLFAWPFLLLACGLVFVAAGDIFSYGEIQPSMLNPVMMVLLFILVCGSAAAIFSSQSSTKSKEEAQGSLLRMKGDVYMFTMALIFPMFIKYLVSAFDKSLAATIAGIIVAFGAILAGMSVKNNRVVSYASIVGGLLSVLYLYGILWDLGEGARIIAAGFGLVVAVVVAVVKFKDKLS